MKSALASCLLLLALPAQAQQTCVQESQLDQAERAAADVESAQLLAELTKQGLALEDLKPRVFDAGERAFAADQVLTAKDGTQEVVTGQAPASGSAPRRSYFFRRGAQLLRVEQPEVARHVSVCGCQTKRRGGVGGARARSLVVAWPVPKGLTFAGTLKVSVPHVVVLFDFNPDCPRLPPPP